MELPHPHRILNAKLQVEPVTLRPMLTRFGQPVPFRLKPFEMEAWDSTNNLDFMAVGDWFPPTGIETEPVVEVTEASAVSPQDYVRPKSSSDPCVLPPIVGPSRSGYGSYRSAPQHSVQLDVMSRCRYGMSSVKKMQDEPLRAGDKRNVVTGLGGPYRNPLGAFNLPEVTRDLSSCAISALEIDPGKVFSVRNYLCRERGIALSSGESSYSSSTVTAKSWDFSPVSEGVDAACDKFSDKLECILPQEILEAEDMSGYFDVQGNVSAPRQDGTWSSEILSWMSPCLSSPREQAPEKEGSMSLSPSKITRSVERDSETGSGHFTPMKYKRPQSVASTGSDPSVAYIEALSGKPCSLPWDECLTEETSPGLTICTPSPRYRALKKLSIASASPRDLSLKCLSLPTLPSYLNTLDCEIGEPCHSDIPARGMFPCQFSPMAGTRTLQEQAAYLSCRFYESDSPTDIESSRADMLSPLSLTSGGSTSGSATSTAPESEMELCQTAVLFST